MNQTFLCSLYITVAYRCQSNMAANPVFYGIFTWYNTQRPSQTVEHRLLPLLLLVLISVEK